MSKNAFASLTIEDLRALRERAAKRKLSDEDCRHITEELLDSLLDIAIDFKQEDERITRAILKCADCGEHGELTGHMGCQYPGGAS